MQNSSIQVPGHGPLDAKLIIIGEAPGKEEVLARQPFVGASGRFIRKKLLRVGIDPEKVRYENLMDTQPPSNDFTYFEQNEAEYANLLVRVQKLKQQIKEMRPNLVLLVGSKPLYYIAGRRNVSDWRGHFFWQEDMDCKCLATYHPSACLRQVWVDAGQFPGQYEALFTLDIQKLALEVGKRELNVPTPRIIINPSYETAMQEMENLLQAGKPLSFDIETFRDIPVMSCIGFANSIEQGICIPIYYSREGSHAQFWEDEEHRARIFQKICQLLESDLPKIGQNLQFDAVILEHMYGIRVRNIVWDTLCAAHNDYCELPKDLGCLISRYSKFPYHKHLGDSSSNQDFWTYNVMDAIVTLDIALGQEKDMREGKILDHFRNVTMPLLRPLIDMQLTGVKLDIPLKTKALASEIQKVEEADWAAAQLVRGFNLGSPDQCKKFFYDAAGCKRLYNKSKLTTDEDAMNKLMTDRRPIIQKLAHLILSRRSAVKMAGVLRIDPPDGRIRTKYSAAGTITGRLNSKEPDIGIGTNLQNLQEGVQREMLVCG